MYILKNETENNDNLNIDESNKGKNIDDNTTLKQIYDENSTKISQENDHFNEEKDISDYIYNRKENIFNEEFNKSNNGNETKNDKKEFNLYNECKDKDFNENLDIDKANLKQKDIIKKKI